MDSILIFPAWRLLYTVVFLLLSINSVIAGSYCERAVKATPQQTIPESSQSFDAGPSAFSIDSEAEDRAQTSWVGPIPNRIDLELSDIRTDIIGLKILIAGKFQSWAILDIYIGKKLVAEKEYVNVEKTIIFEKKYSGNLISLVYNNLSQPKTRYASKYAELTDFYVVYSTDGVEECVDKTFYEIGKRSVALPEGTGSTLRDYDVAINVLNELIRPVAILAAIYLLVFITKQMMPRIDSHTVRYVVVVAMSLVSGLLGAVIPGQLSVDVMRGSSTLISATSGGAMFLLVLFLGLRFLRAVDEER